MSWRPREDMARAGRKTPAVAASVVLVCFLASGPLLATTVKRLGLGGRVRLLLSRHRTQLRVRRLARPGLEWRSPTEHISLSLTRSVAGAGRRDSCARGLGAAGARSGQS